MTEQRRKYEKDKKDAERVFERAKREWLVTWRDDERHQRDSDRKDEQNSRKREREQRDADRDLSQLEKLLERREAEAAQRFVLSFNHKKREIPYFSQIRFIRTRLVISFVLTHLFDRAPILFIIIFYCEYCWY